MRIHYAYNENNNNVYKYQQDKPWPELGKKVLHDTCNTLSFRQSGFGRNKE
jgi:hypothetical protein